MKRREGEREGKKESRKEYKIEKRREGARRKGWEGRGNRRCSMCISLLSEERSLGHRDISRTPTHGQGGQR